MSLSPESRAALDLAVTASVGLGLRMFDPVEARRIGRANVPGPVPIEGVGFTDLQIPGTGDEVLAGRLFGPEGATAPLPLLVYLHGGGWVLGDLDTHHAFCGALARTAGVLVLSLAYGLAPEHPFPGAVDDAVATLRWAAGQSGRLGAEPALLGVAGDSAGATVAAAAILSMQQSEGSGAGVVSIGTQILFYPPLDARCETASYRRHATDGGTITLAQMRWFWAQYADAAAYDDPLVSPLRADPRRFPPTLVVVAGVDPLHDDGRDFAAGLRQAGVRVQLREYPHTFHGFLGFPGLAETADALQSVAAWVDDWRRGWPQSPEGSVPQQRRVHP